MQIDKVKIQKNGYLVNDTSFVPNNPENCHFRLIREYIANGGIAEPEFSDEERKESLKEKIRSEASRRILTPYPEYKQRNFLAKVALIHNEEVKALKRGENYELSEEEQAIINAAQALEKFISNIRTKCNDLINSLETKTSEELENMDITKDELWAQ